jgi:adenosylmethionine-8-amino-7-oxononanoate aminotransferase
VRIKGGISVLELNQPVNMAAISKRFVDKGVWIRPFGKLVYVMPPYVISDEELDRLLTAMTEAVAEELET